VARGIPVHTVGVGNPASASTIPFDDEVLFHDGDKVWTKLEEGPLQEIARATDGAYVPMRTSDYPLGELFLERIATGAIREHGEDALPVYRQRFAWFLGPAFGMLLLAIAVGDGTRRRPARGALPLY
jgi:hypothetical protein